MDQTDRLRGSSSHWQWCIDHSALAPRRTSRSTCPLPRSSPCRRPRSSRICPGTDRPCSGSGPGRDRCSPRRCCSASKRRCNCPGPLPRAGPALEHPPRQESQRRPPGSGQTSRAPWVSSEVGSKICTPTPPSSSPFSSPSPLSLRKPFPPLPLPLPSARGRGRCRFSALRKMPCRRVGGVGAIGEPSGARRQELEHEETRNIETDREKGKRGRWSARGSIAWHFGTMSHQSFRA